MNIKRIICWLLAVILVLALCGCDWKGYDFIDTNYHFDRAIIAMPDGTILEVAIDTWADAEGEQLTITDKNGNRYLTSSINCILIEDAT